MYSQTGRVLTEGIGADQLPKMYREEISSRIVDLITFCHIT